MSRNFFILSLLAIVLLALYVYHTNVSQINQDYSSIPTPTIFTPHYIQTSCGSLRITEPFEGQKVSDKITITAIVDNTKKNCHWTVFEAQAGTAEAADENGTVLDKKPLTTNGDWMSSKPTAYSTELTLPKTIATNNIYITITEEDPSGRQGAQTLTIPLEAIKTSP